MLNAYVAEFLGQVREITAEWLQQFNQERPMSCWRSYCPPTIGLNLKPEILLCHCLLDGDSL